QCDSGRLRLTTCSGSGTLKRASRGWRRSSFKSPRLNRIGRNQKERGRNDTCGQKLVRDQQRSFTADIRRRRFSARAGASGGQLAGKKVTIIILTWNGLAYTKRCHETLRRRTTFPDYEVVEVYNGSTDGTVEYLRSLPWLRLLEKGRKLGFAKGNNRALEECGGDCDYVLLNNDTEIIQTEWLSRLQATAYGAPKVGIVGARLRRPD